MLAGRIIIVIDRIAKIDFFVAIVGTSKTEDVLHHGDWYVSRIIPDRRPARPRKPRPVYDIELTYTSNAIEGNTLTAAETRMIIEHGITIGGKPLKDHLEAVDHFEALHYVRDLARLAVPLRETDIRNLHRLVMQRSDPETAGRYANQGRYVETDSGRYHFPSPAEVPALMGDFPQWLGTAVAIPETAFTAHRRLVEIHPFDDGNSRTARLLMNLVLLRGGYPPVAVRPQIGRPISAHCRTRKPGAAARDSTAFFTRDWTQRWGSP